MILYTSDLHFGHSNVIRFDHRPFADRDEMDHVLKEVTEENAEDETPILPGGDLYPAGIIE